MRYYITKLKLHLALLEFISVSIALLVKMLHHGYDVNKFELRLSRTWLGNESACI